LCSVISQGKVVALDRWGGKWSHLSMTHRLATNSAKNYCNQTLIVKVIVENVVTCFFWGTRCSYPVTSAVNSSCDKSQCHVNNRQRLKKLSFQRNDTLPSTTLQSSDHVPSLSAGHMITITICHHTNGEKVTLCRTAGYSTGKQWPGHDSQNATNEGMNFTDTKLHVDKCLLVTSEFILGLPWTCQPQVVLHRQTDRRTE